MTVRLPHIQAVKDQKGRWRYYFRKPGLPRRALPGAPGSAEFLAAYDAALDGQEAPPRAKGQAAAPGTFNRLIGAYYASVEFLRTKPSSQAVTRGVLDRFAAEHGHRIVRQMTRQHVSTIIGGKAETPAAANVLLKKLRALMAFAIANGDATIDPTAKVARFKEGSHHTWTDDELAQFEARWPLGTRQRTAYAMALYTGQRRADLARWTRRHYDATAGTMTVKQEKTGKELAIPMHSALREALEAWKPQHIVLLAHPDGRGTSVAGLGNLMADAIGAAGLPDRCVLHGLRKAAARRLAEAGCTTLEIMAVTGHQSLKEVERYTVAASQVSRAQSAIEKVERNEKRPSNVKPGGKFYTVPKKRGKS